MSGEGYEAYVRRHILEPAGMAHSGYAVAQLRAFPEVVTFHAAREQDGVKEIYAAPNWLYSAVWSPAGGLNTTVRDLLRYLEIYRTGGMVGEERLLSAAGIARMTAPHAPWSNPYTSYGYGLAVIPDYHGVKVIRHGGGRKGIAADVTVAPERGLTAAAIANLAGVPVGDATLAALNAELGLPLDTPVGEYVDVPCPPERLTRYTGTYRSGEGANITVTAEDGALVVAFEGKRITARPVGEDAFVLATETGEQYTRFLMRGDPTAWAMTMGSRIVPRYTDAQELSTT